MQKNKMKSLFSTILVDIRKDKVIVRSLDSDKEFLGELFIWTTSKDLKEIVVCVGSKFKSDASKVNESDCIKTKVFHPKEGLIVGDYEKAAAAMLFLVNSYNKNKLVKPIIIWNSPENLSKVEVRALYEISETIGGRQFILLQEKGNISDIHLGPGKKIPYHIVEGVDEYSDGKKVFIIIIVILVVFIFSTGSIKFMS